MAKVVWLAAAVDDLEAIFERVAADNPAAARSLVHGILQATDRLAEFPLSARQVPDNDDPSIRQVIFRDYVIVYRTRGDLVEVALVYHGSRLPPRPASGTQD